MSNSETVLEINLNTLEHNFEFIKSKLKPNTKTMAVVKAFGYGSESSSIALKLEKLNIDYFAVAYTNEGIALRTNGVKKPIMVLHPQPCSLEDLVEFNLEPSLYNFRISKLFLEVLKKKNIKNYPIHFKFNTGLNRLGFNFSEILDLATLINSSENIKLISILSHLAASEDLNEKEFTEIQIKKFNSIFNELTRHINFKPIRHLCNTSGILNYPEAHYEMVRCGISLYGFGNDPEFDKYLKPISTLKTTISQIHTLQKGESLGYNRSFIAEEEIKTATLPIGHADGINRIYGKEKGYVFINNQKAVILGNTCMDMIMVDVTSINCKEGDEAIIFNEKYSANDLATNAGTISYELVTSISQRVKRVIID
jgi:alanine racemase